jgi:hypothetical protein
MSSILIWGVTHSSRHYCRMLSPVRRSHHQLHTWREAGKRQLAVITVRVSLSLHSSFSFLSQCLAATKSRNKDDDNESPCIVSQPTTWHHDPRPAASSTSLCTWQLLCCSLLTRPYSSRFSLSGDLICLSLISKAFFRTEDTFLVSLRILNAKHILR